MRARRVLTVAGLIGLAMLVTACGSGSSSSSAPAATPAPTVATSPATPMASTAPAATSASFCKDAATAKSQLLVWTTATPGTSAASAEPLATSFQTLAAEAPTALKSQLQDLAATFVQLEKYDKVTDPNTLLKEGPLTNGHVIPDSNALATYVSAHCS